MGLALSFDSAEMPCSMQDLAPPPPDSCRGKCLLSALNHSKCWRFAAAVAATFSVSLHEWGSGIWLNGYGGTLPWPLIFACVPVWKKMHTLHTSNWTLLKLITKDKISNPQGCDESSRVSGRNKRTNTIWTQSLPFSLIGIVSLYR